MDKVGKIYGRTPPDQINTHSPASKAPPAVNQVANCMNSH